MTGFAVRDHHYVVINDDGTERPYPWPGHADSIIEALRRHGGTAKTTTRTAEGIGWVEERREVPAPEGVRGRERWRWEVNSYLIERGIERGLLIDNGDGTVSLNVELAELWDQFEAWKRQNQRNADQARIMARDFELSRTRGEYR